MLESTESYSTDDYLLFRFQSSFDVQFDFEVVKRLQLCKNYNIILQHLNCKIKVKEVTELSNPLRNSRKQAQHMKPPQKVRRSTQNVVFFPCHAMHPYWLNHYIFEDPSNWSDLQGL